MQVAQSMASPEGAGVVLVLDEGGLQPLESVAHPGLHGVLWRADHVGDLHDGQVGVLAEHEDLALIARQRLDGHHEAALQLVADGVVADADLADAGVIFGTGFAPFTGGPLHFKPLNN